MIQQRIIAFDRGLSSKRALLMRIKDLKTDRFLQFHAQTRKDLNHVHKTYEDKLAGHVHRLNEILKCAGEAAVSTPQPDLISVIFKSIEILPVHRSIVLHSILLHIALFSEFEINHQVLTPVWMKVAREGSGLRAVSLDYIQHFDRLAVYCGQIVGSFSLIPLMQYSEAWTAISMFGVFILASMVGFKFLPSKSLAESEKK